MRSASWIAIVLLSFGCTKSESGLGGGAGRGPGLSIAPDNPVVRVVNGVAAAVELELIRTAKDGSREVITHGVLWRVDDDRFGTFPNEAAPRFVAIGQRAGVATIEAHFENQVAIGTVRVEVEDAKIEGGAPANAGSIFTGPTATHPSGAFSIAYPLEGAMIPKNLVPMAIQWDAPADVDLFRLVLRGAVATQTIYTAQRIVQLPVGEWTRVIESTAPGELTVELSGVNSANPAQTFVANTVHLTVSAAQMRGTIYYWAVNVGRILRIRPGAETYEDFFRPPAAADGNQCVGCHTLSRDGNLMAFEYYGGWSTHGVVDVANPNPPMIGPGVIGGNYSAFDPTGSVLLTSMNGILSTRQSANGTLIEQLALPTLATQPAWSPDGSTIAYIAQVPGQAFADVDFFFSDLTVMRGANGARTAPEIIVPADGQANTYPSFSPDSRYLAYSRGPYSRSHTQYDPANGSAVSPGDVWLASLDRSTPPVKLDRASAGGQAFLPAFSPFESDGVMWVAFFSRRDYGLVTRGTHRRQIWVAAIDTNAPGGVDPSHVGFWLPAQDSTTENMSAYWSEDGCRAAGGGCQLDSDCCDGSVCRPDGSGGSSCTPRDLACRALGEPCIDAGECCADVGIISCELATDGVNRCKVTSL